MVKFFIKITKLIIFKFLLILGSYVKGEPDDDNHVPHEDGEKDNDDCCAAENGEGELRESNNHEGRFVGKE